MWHVFHCLHTPHNHLSYKLWVLNPILSPHMGALPETHKLWKLSTWGVFVLQRLHVLKGVKSRISKNMPKPNIGPQRQHTQTLPIPSYAPLVQNLALVLCASWPHSLKQQQQLRVQILYRLTCKQVMMAYNNGCSVEPKNGRMQRHCERRRDAERWATENAGEHH